MTGSGDADLYLLFLVRGPSWMPGDTPELQDIQRGHIAHLEQMWRDGHALLAGPFADQTELRGIVVVRASSLEAARALEDDDPAVKVGRLAVEAHAWSPSLERLGRAVEPFEMSTFPTALLRRDDAGGTGPTAGDRKLMAGHARSLRRLSRHGDLLLGGDFDDAGEPCGFLILRPSTLTQARALLASDPAVRAGILQPEMHPLGVGRGTLVVAEAPAR